jgi:hypothetical protein
MTIIHSANMHQELSRAREAERVACARRAELIRQTTAGKAQLELDKPPSRTVVGAWHRSLAGL